MSHNDRNGAVVVMVVMTVTCSMPSAGCEPLPRPLVSPRFISSKESMGHVYYPHGTNEETEA